MPLLLVNFFITGIGGLEDHILKSGTLSSTVACPAFTDLYFDVSPILRVALEPTQAGKGLRCCIVKQQVHITIF